MRYLWTSEQNIPIRKLADIGFHIYLTNIEINFIKGLPLENIVTIKSRINSMNRLTSIWIQEIYNNSGDLCSVANVKGVFVKNGKPVRLSKDLFEQFKKFSE
jgi:acyl-CoA thioesterase FadM